MPNGNSEVDEKSVLARVRRSVLPAAFLLYTFSYMDRASISYAQLTMSADLGFDIATYGMVAAIFFLPYTLLEIPSNIVMSKVGPRLWLGRIAISWGAATMLTGFVANTSHLFIARAALGVAEAGLFPGLVLYLTYWFAPEDRGRGLVGMMLAQPVALILGGLSGGLILDHVHWFGLNSWRWVFILQGLPPMLLGLWVLWTMANRPKDARWLNPAEGAWLERRVAAQYLQDEESHEAAGLKAFRNPRILHLACIGLLGGVGTYGMTFFLPQVIAQINPQYSPTNIGLVGAIPYLCGAVAMVLIGRFSDRTGNRKAVVIGCLSTSVVGLCLTMAFQSTPVIGVLGLSMLAIGILGYLAPFWAFASESMTRGQSAVGLALINSVAATGGFFGPYLIGFVAKAIDVTFGLIVPAAALALAIALLSFVRPVRVSGLAEGADRPSN